MTQKSLFSLLLSLLLLIHCHKTLLAAQSPAPAPAPPGPTDVLKILKKAGKFKTFIRLLKATQLDSNLNSQLGNTNNGLTIFAPSDSAFSSLKASILKSLTNQEKLELAQFHIIPMFLPSSQFDTVSNPLATHAGSGSRFLLNVTTSGTSVNISTGLTNTSISDTVYTDNHLAIYQVDNVLLPLDIFTPKPPAPAPAPARPLEKSTSNEESSNDGVPEKYKSAAVSFVVHHNLVFLGVVAAMVSL